MPIHDWTRVEAGIFHGLHHEWISELARALNRLLPADYYAMPEQVAAGIVPDVLTLQGTGDADAGARGTNGASPTGTLLAPPKLAPVSTTDMSGYRRKRNLVAVRHVSGDDVVAMIEIVSPGNKASRHPLRAFVQKAAELLDQQIHLLILDLFPPGKRDPSGIHAAIWEEITGEEEYALPADKPLTFAAYETGNGVRAYVVHAAVGDALPDMPLFLERGLAIDVPLEATYQAAFAAMPLRWRRVLDPQAG